MRFFPFLLLVLANSLYAQYPVIASLDPRSGDVLFEQYIRNVEKSRQLVYNKQRPVEPKTVADQLTLFEYKPRSADDLYSVASRCNIPPSTLATLNHIAHPGNLPSHTILLPSVPGIFVPLDRGEGAENDLEKLMAGSRLSEDQAEKGIIIKVRKNERFFFMPGEEFTATEVAFFLTFGKDGKGFSYPLRRFTLTSNFGMRKNPITGVVRNHDGLDLAAPMGAEVFAAQSGVITETGNDPIYGNYIIIKHEGDWASLYGHLSKIETGLNKSVSAGAVIGRVGSTGQSTGPHLHFELRRNGKAQDPGKYLFKND